MESRVRRVKVKTIQGTIHDFEVVPEIAISDLKALIDAKFGVEPASQRLIYKAKLVKDEHRLNDYINEDDQTIQLLVRGQANAPVQNAEPGQTVFSQQGQVQVMPGQDLGSIFSNVFQNLGPQIANIVQGGPIPGQRPGPPQQPPAAPFNAVQPPAAQPSVPQQVPAPDQPADRQNIELPFDNITNLSDIINRLMGPGVSSPHALPQTNLPPNPLTNLGNWLHNYQTQLTRLMPYLGRLGDLLQRESLITDQSHRQNLQDLAGQISTALGEIHQATLPVVDCFQTLNMGSRPGSFEMRYQNRSIIAQQNQPEPPQQPRVQAAAVPQQPPAQAAAPQQPPAPTTVPQPAQAVNPPPNPPSASVSSEESKISKQHLLRQVDIGRRIRTAFSEANVPLPLLEIPPDIKQAYQEQFRNDVANRIAQDPRRSDQTYPACSKYFKKN